MFAPDEYIKRDFTGTHYSMSPDLADIMFDEDRLNELAARFEQYPKEPRLDALRHVFPELFSAEFCA